MSKKNTVENAVEKNGGKDREKTCKIIREVLEQYNFSIHEDYSRLELNICTPAGEDWWICLNFPEDIFDYAEDFDSDSEFEMWVEAKIQGDKSVPGYPELYKDQLWKEKILKDVVVEIRKRIKKESQKES